MVSNKEYALHETVSICDSVEIRYRHYFSISHIQSAALFARQANHIENIYDGKYSEKLISEHIAYVSGAIFFSVSFLEASINELFADCDDEEILVNDTAFSVFDKKIAKSMAENWMMGIPKTASYPIVEKYQTALKIAGEQLFERGRSPCQDIILLIQLRNALIHYKPEWIISISDDRIPEHKFESSFRGKFKINPITSAGNPFYPDKVLGHGCAEWAVKKSISFIDEFYLRMNIKPRFDHIRENLSTMGKSENDA